MSKLRVVFDIGHGSDTYPPSKGIKLPDGSVFAEHTFNSAVAVKAKELAEFNGFEVLLPQQPNAKEVPLGVRSTWINNEHKKSPILCLMSFHANAADNPNASGWCVFYWHSSTNGKKLADLWVKHAKQILPLKPWNAGILASRPNSWTNFHILRETAMPAILIEHFFFTNLNELKQCNTPEFIDKAAEVAVRALCEYAGIQFKQKKEESTMILKVGVKGSEVKQLQENLNKLGFDCGIADGIFGPKTEAAVRAFQKVYGLAVDGIAGPATLGKIDELLKQTTRQTESRALQDRINQLEAQIGALQGRIKQLESFFVNLKKIISEV